MPGSIAAGSVFSLDKVCSKAIYLWRAFHCISSELDGLVCEATKLPIEG
jgi:hypothetical protein